MCNAYAMRVRPLCNACAGLLSKAAALQARSMINGNMAAADQSPILPIAATAPPLEPVSEAIKTSAMHASQQCAQAAAAAKFACSASDIPLGNCMHSYCWR